MLTTPTLSPHEPTLADIEACLANLADSPKDLSLVSREAHQILGTAGNLGTAQLSANARAGNRLPGERRRESNPLLRRAQGVMRGGFRRHQYLALDEIGARREKASSSTLSSISRNGLPAKAQSAKAGAACVTRTRDPRITKR